MIVDTQFKMTKLNRLFYLVFMISVLISCSTDDSSDDTGGGSSPDKAENLKPLGTSAQDLVSDGFYQSMTIEVGYVPGNKPTDEALNLLGTFLQARVYKPGGITIKTREINSSGKAPFTETEIRNIEREQREFFTTGDDIAVWIYFADGSKDGDSDQVVTLGSAYRNTSMVIYSRTIRDFSGRPGAPSRAAIEAATLRHEFGHLFGLVDIGTPMVRDHLADNPDSDDPSGHCDISGCLMQTRLEFGSGVIDIIEGTGIPELQEYCIEDLQAIGGR